MRKDHPGRLLRMGSEEDEMIDAMTFIFGIIAGLAVWFFTDTMHNPYLRGYRDGWDQAQAERRKKDVE